MNIKTEKYGPMIPGESGADRRKRTKHLRYQADAAALKEKQKLVYGSKTPEEQHQYCADNYAKAKVKPGYDLTRKNQRLISLYGITLEEFNADVALQDGKCAICGGDPQVLGQIRGLVVDHDHKTGRVRAPLCNVCNTGLGKFKESAELLRKAANYIDEHNLRYKVAQIRAEAIRRVEAGSIQ